MRSFLFALSAVIATPAFAQYYGQTYAPPQTYAQGTYEQRYREQYYGDGSMQHAVAQSQFQANQGLAKGDYLNIGVGATQVFDTNNKALLNIEYRYKDIYYGLRPILGAHIDTDNAKYGYFGFNWDLFLTDSIVFTPTAAMGAYSHGSGHKLGHGLEFRTGVELAYQLEESKSRVGLQLTHLSNAGIGRRNPGTEILQLNYAWPLGLAGD